MIIVLLVLVCVGLAVAIGLYFNLLPKAYNWLVAISGLASIVLGIHYNNKGGILQIVVGVALVLAAAISIFSTRAKA